MSIIKINRTLNRIEPDEDSSNMFKFVVNGWTLSVIWGSQTQATTKYLNPSDGSSLKRWANTVEIAVIDPDGVFRTEEFIDCKGKEVHGFTTVADVSRVLSALCLLQYKDENNNAIVEVEVTDRSPAPSRQSSIPTWKKKQKKLLSSAFSQGEVENYKGNYALDA
jgi:hypothetical protein